MGSWGLLAFGKGATNPIDKMPARRVPVCVLISELFTSLADNLIQRGYFFVGLAVLLLPFEPFGLWAREPRCTDCVRKLRLKENRCSVFSLLFWAPS